MCSKHDRMILEPTLHFRGENVHPPPTEEEDSDHHEYEAAADDEDPGARAPAS